MRKIKPLYLGCFGVVLALPVLAQQGKVGRGRNDQLDSGRSDQAS